MSSSSGTSSYKNAVTTGLPPVSVTPPTQGQPQLKKQVERAQLQPQRRQQELIETKQQQQQRTQRHSEEVRTRVRNFQLSWPLDWIEKDYSRLIANVGKPENLQSLSQPSDTLISKERVDLNNICKAFELRNILAPEECHFLIDAANKVCQSSFLTRSY